MTVYVGIDGSQAQHDVCFLDEADKATWMWECGHALLVRNGGIEYSTSGRSLGP
jgi:hypothetical protein